MSKSILLLTVSIFSAASAADFKSSGEPNRGGTSVLVRQQTQQNAPQNEGQLNAVWGQAKAVFLEHKLVAITLGAASAVYLAGLYCEEGSKAALAIGMLKSLGLFLSCLYTG